jgi:hypothetical protein
MRPDLQRLAPPSTVSSGRCKGSATFLYVTGHASRPRLIGEAADGHHDRGRDAREEGDDDDRKAAALAAVPGVASAGVSGPAFFVNGTVHRTVGTPNGSVRGRVRRRIRSTRSTSSSEPR